MTTLTVYMANMITTSDSNFNPGLFFDVVRACAYLRSMVEVYHLNYVPSNAQAMIIITRTFYNDLDYDAIHARE